MHNFHLPVLFIILLAASTTDSRVPLGARSPHFNRFIRGTSLFDPLYAHRELQSIFSKYQHATELLQGIGLSSNQTIPDDLLTPQSQGLSLDAAPDAPEKPFIPPIWIAPGTSIMPLRDFISGDQDILYYGPINIGTPAHALTVDFDTGSADLWVPVDCASCTNTHFAAGKSSTYRNTGRKSAVIYGSGAVSGTLAVDVVSIAGLSVEKQSFIAVNTESDDFMGNPADGLIGMAFGTISQSGQSTFFENLIRERKVAAPMFSVHLARNSETGSEVCLGCHDPSKTTGMISWVSVKSKTYWSVAMDAIVIDKVSVLPTDLIAAIDTGTTFIYVPDEVAQRFYEMIPGTRPASQYGSGFYTYPCSANLDIAFSFSGKRFSIALADFNLGQTVAGSGDCVGGIISVGDQFPSNLAIIGDEFLRSWYTTYDYSNGARVGFSPSINNPM